MQDTMIVLTSDHGDYLGDHWLGEKDLFHAPSVKVPLIVFDPRASADGTRGTTCDALVEGIDLAATFIEAAGAEVPDHIIEGRSLVPFLRGETPENWRAVAISEYDYSVTSMAAELGVAPKDARLFMVASERWKLMHAEGGFGPMLFDLENDPDELHDLGGDPEYATVRAEMYDHLFRWARRESQRVTVSDDAILKRRSAGGSARKGILLGAWDESDVPPDILAVYTELSSGTDK
jgi:arylsulfatase A-like enzyme